MREIQIVEQTNLKRFLEDVSGVNVTLPENALKIGMGIEDTAALVQSTMLQTAETISALVREQARLIEATRSITIAATCTNGYETRQAIADATDKLQAAKSRFVREASKIFSKAKFITPRYDVLGEVRKYIDDLSYYAGMYTAIEPISGSENYRQEMRDSQKAKDNLLEFIAENDPSFVDACDRIAGTPKDIDAKRYIQKKALELDPNPQTGEFAELGQEVYKLIRNYSKPTVKVRRAIELLSEYFSETGQALDNRGLGVFMSGVCKLG